MPWWLILIFILIGVGVLGGAYSSLRRFSQSLSVIPELLRGLSSSLSSSGTEPAAPRSLSSLESVLLPRVLEDFPEYNRLIIAERVKKDAKLYYESGIAGEVLYKEGISAQFRQSFSAALPAQVKDGVIVHKVALHAYDARSLDRILTYQASVQYTDTTDEIRQKRLVLKYMAAFTDNPSEEIRSYNCPNCGAPLPIVGKKKCQYCGAALKTPAGLGWLLVEAFEG